MPEENKADKIPTLPPDIETPDGRMEVLKRARKGDRTVQPFVEKLLDRDQRENGKLMEIYGNSFNHACVELTKLASGDDLFIRESLLRKIHAIRDDLAGPNPTPLERLLCERVALCWFDAHEMDRRYADQTEISFKNADFRESRRDRAHKRFLGACKALANVRRLGFLAIQLNVAQQVNLAGST